MEKQPVMRFGTKLDEGSGGSGVENYVGPSLSELQQEPSQDYSSIIKKADRIMDHDSGLAWWQTNHSRMLDDLQPGTIHYEHVSSEIIKLFNDSLAGSILCDLGSAGARMDWLAAAYHVSTYLEVDKFPFGSKEDENPIDPAIARVDVRQVQDLSKEPGSNKEFPYPYMSLPTLSVRADMLDFISRVKDSSVNIVINGIDTDIIEPKEYHEFLAREMLRAVKDNGLIFGNNSTSLSSLERMIREDKYLQDKFEIVENKLGAGGVIVVHKMKAEK